MKRWNSKRYTIFAHLKRDGFNIRVKDGKVLSKNDKDWTDMLAWHPHVRVMLDNPQYEFHCEAWVPNTRASSAITHIKSESNDLRVDCYSILELGDCFLWAVAEECDRLCVPFIPYLIHTDSLPLNEEIDYSGYAGRYNDPFDQSIYDKFPDIEGLVLKNHNCDEMFKVKPTKDIDLIVTALIPGKGANHGVIGSLVCSTIEGVVICNAGALTMIDRKRKDWIGKVVEIEYDYVGDGGKLRFPRYVRTRIDKSKSECTLDQDPDLKAHYES